MRFLYHLSANVPLLLEDTDTSKLLLTSDINYETLKMCHYTQGGKETMNWKKTTVLPSCLHIPHFLFLGGSEEVGTGRLVPLGSGNTCRNNECSRLMEVDINRVKKLKCESHWASNIHLLQQYFVTIKVKNTL